MANQNIGTPRFYTDQINFLMSRGIAQDGNFDVSTGSNLIAPESGYSEAELFDMNPLNLVSFDTTTDSGNDHVLISINLQTTYKKSFVAILNHNLDQCNGKIRINASNTKGHIEAADMGSATLSPSCTEVVNADDISTNIITPGTDGSTIVKFAESELLYWGIQFEGDPSFNSTKLTVGNIIIGEYYDMPHSPDMNVTRMISYNRMNDLQESHGGQRFSNLKSYGRHASSTSRSPFNTTDWAHLMYGGRLIYDMSFSFLDSADLMPDEYDILDKDDENFVDDVWNKTNGNHLPFIMSIDKSSEGDDAESEHIFGRFANNSLDMAQVAPNVFNVKLTVEEEF